MKTIRKFMKPMSGIMAMLILLMSCEQYDQDLNLLKQAFNYDSFNQYQNDSEVQSIFQSLTKHLKSNSDTYQNNKQMLESVNRQYGTNLELPDEFLHLSIEMQAWEIYDQSKKKGWLTQNEVSLFEEFSTNIEIKGLDFAIRDYENQILSLNLPSEEFAKHNAFLNIIKTVDYENPDLFRVDSQGRSPWRCALALVALTAAIASASSYLTIAACAIAAALLINASYAVMNHCGGLSESDSFADA